MATKQHYGEMLKKYVKERGFSQTAIAEKLGVSNPTVSQYFASVSPSIDTISRVCDALGVPVWHFVASVETGIPTIFFEAMDTILSLEQPSREYVLRRLAEEVEFICGLTEKGN